MRTRRRSYWRSVYRHCLVDQLRHFNGEQRCLQCQYEHLWRRRPFPMPPSTTLPNQPGFVFDFFVATGDIDPLADVFFNLIFGDYDVVPAGLGFIRADGSTFAQALTVQAPTADGLIQSAFATLAFADVFTSALGGFSGYLAVNFNAPNEPYTAFDFVELAVTPISVDPTPVPEPGTLSLLAAGLLGLAIRRRRRRVA
ncbi:MAG: PEP-CTERM sorting domain-containing protein [Gammaproteobacteria bacterium]|nr:PEP-CTERM sorting domain-containing protein [Gammaproteobacteria bacterium]